MARKDRQTVQGWGRPDVPAVCPLCVRDIPPEQEDKHHLVPKSKGGKVTQVMHRICHRQIHALFTETELAREFSSAEALLQNPEVQKFVKWVSTKPPGFYLSPKSSHRKR